MSGHYIEFQDVSISFGEQDVLKNVSFFVERGETMVIMGRSGVGKSVSLKIIMGFLKADSGRVMVAERDVTEATEAEFAEARKKVTMVFQSGGLFDSMTVAQNVAFPLEGREAMDEAAVSSRVNELMEMLEVKEFAGSLPSDLNTGAKRAVAIARALAHDPECILYDEPTTMVDPLMSLQMASLILRLKEKFHKTSIVVTHDTHLGKKLADKLVFLQEGRVAYFGTWKEFEATQDPYLKLFQKEDALIPALDLQVSDGQLQG